MPTSSKKPRTLNERCDLQTMSEVFDPLARLRDPGFDWSLAFYGKTRSQGPDTEGLRRYKPILKVLFTVAPSGLPSHVDLRAVLKY